MQQFTVGSTATFYCTFARLDGSAVDPVTPTVEVWLSDSLIVSAVPMVKISVGYYYATWTVPGAQPTGTYSALYKGTIDGIVCQASEDFELTVAGGGVMPISGYYCTWDDVKACLLGLDIGDIPDTLQTRMTSFYIPTLKREIDQYCRQNFDKTTITEFYNGSTTEVIAGLRRPIKNLFYCVLRVIPSISWYTFRRWRNINVIESTGVTVAYQGGPEPDDETIQPPYPDLDGYSGTSGFSGVGYTWESDITKADLFVDCSNGILTIPPRILYLEMQAIPFWNYTFLRGNNNVEIQYEYGYEDNNFPNDLRLAAAKLVACQVLLIKSIIQSGGGTNSIAIDGVSRSFGGGTPYSALITDFRTQAYATLDRYRRIKVS